MTNSGAAYVKSFSLHSSAVYFGGSKRWLENDSDIEDPKSSIGEISSKISSRPDVEGTSWRPASAAAATRACHASLPSSQSKLSVWRPSRSGTSSGSKILAKERRRDAVRFAMASADGAEGVREAAKRGPSLQIERTLHRPGWTRSPPPRHLADAHVRRRGGRGYMRSGAQDSAKREHTPRRRHHTTSGHTPPPGPGRCAPRRYSHEPRRPSSGPPCGP
ncbi:Uncharacterised protein [Mycobacteroides abscessus]|nr:Uncharacterised protein [Mycobacteroides abscessus]